MSRLLAVWLRRRRVRWLRATAREVGFVPYGAPRWLVVNRRQLEREITARADALERRR